MIFPINVSSRLRNAGKSGFAEKSWFTIFLIILGNIIMFGMLSPMFTASHISIIFLLLLQLVLTIIVVTTVFRVFIVKEKDKLQEHNMSKTASISNYFHIINKDRMKYVRTAPLFEYDDGSMAVMVRLTYGANNEYKSKQSAMFMNKLYTETLRHGLEIRTINMPEDFKQSQECKVMTSNLSGIEQDKLRSAMSELVNYMLDYTEKNSELMSTTIIIRTVNQFQYDHLVMLLGTIISTYNSINSSIRGLTFLDKEQMRIFMSKYYRLEALDLSSLHVKSIKRELILEFKNKVKVARVNYTTGKHKTITKQHFKNGVTKF